MSRFGRYKEIGGRPAVVFDRPLKHSQDRVWASIATLDGLGGWFPMRVEGELAPNGSLAFHLPDGTVETGAVLVHEPPSRLRFTWGAEEVWMELAPSGDGCTLTLTNILEDRNEAARNGAGFELCVADLEAYLDTGAKANLDWEATYAAYLDAGLPSGAPVPG